VQDEIKSFTSHTFSCRSPHALIAWMVVAIKSVGRTGRALLITLGADGGITASYTAPFVNVITHKCPQNWGD
jgi:hypothetical protein